VEQISPQAVTLSHAAIPSAGWPAMTMQFALASPNLARGLRVGDRVTFGFEQTPKGVLVRELGKAGSQ